MTVVTKVSAEGYLILPALTFLLIFLEDYVQEQISYEEKWFVGEDDLYDQINCLEEEWIAHSIEIKVWYEVKSRTEKIMGRCNVSYWNLFKSR